MGETRIARAWIAGSTGGIRLGFGALKARCSTAQGGGGKAAAALGYVNRDKSPERAAQKKRHSAPRSHAFSGQRRKDTRRTSIASLRNRVVIFSCPNSNGSEKLDSLLRVL